jgi:hypothetical protein
LYASRKSRCREGISSGRLWLTRNMTFSALAGVMANSGLPSNARRHVPFRRGCWRAFRSRLALCCAAVLSQLHSGSRVPGAAINAASSATAKCPSRCRCGAWNAVRRPSAGMSRSLLNFEPGSLLVEHDIDDHRRQQA